MYSNTSRNRRSEGKAHTGQYSLVYHATGQLTTCIRAIRACYANYPRGGRRRREAAMLNNIADVYARIGNHSELWSYMSRHCNYPRGGDRARRITTLNNIADVYYDLGKLTTWLKLYEHAYSASRNRRSEGKATTLSILRWSIMPPPVTARV